MSEFQKIVEASGGDGAAGSDVIQAALAAIRQHLGMEIAYFSEFVEGRSVFRRVDAPGLEHMIKVGDSYPLEDVYCRHIVEGRLPELIPDTSLEPFASAMPITKAVPIGSHASIPVRLPDGRPFGMFCCLSPAPNRTLNERDLATMRVFADLATRQVHADLERRARERERRAAVEAILFEARFAIAFQPIFDLTTMTMVSVEALCRFDTQPYRSPDKWFEDAGQVGLGVELELAAIAEAVSALRDLPDGISLSVNASPDTILSTRLAEALDPSRLDRTVLEVTEHARVHDYMALHAALAPLRSAGMRVAIDDAGAGYSGLQHIVQMAPDMIKIDMSLSRGIDHGRARRALAAAMIFYARETGSAVVAEGVETEAELETLKILGIARGQGYLLGRPAALAALDFGGSGERLTA